MKSNFFINLKIAFNLLTGFILGLLALAAILWIILTLVFPNEPAKIVAINDRYYYETQVDSFAWDATITEISIKRKRDFWFDGTLASLTKDGSVPYIQVEITASDTLNVWINLKQYVHHSIHDGKITMNPEDF